MHLFIVILFAGFLDEFTFIVEFTEEIGSQFVVCGRCGARVDVERYPKLLKRLLDKAVVAVYHILRCNALFSRPQGDGHAMLVAASDKHHVLLLQAQVSHIDVGWYIDTSQMTDMHATIGIGQGGSDGRTLEFLLLHCYFQIFCKDNANREQNEKNSFFSFAEMLLIFAMEWQN